MKKHLLFISLIIIFTGCNKMDIASNTPKCIKKKIQEFNKQENLCGDASVEEYRFQMQKVYVFSPGSCWRDGGSSVYDKDCNNLGMLGGFNGNTELNGEEFSTATFQRTIWKK